MSQIEFSNVWKEYGRQVVLENINLTVGEGEFCTIVGASGCGKTTFLRMLLGQECPSRGAIRLDGDELQRLTREAIVVSVGPATSKSIRSHGMTVGLESKKHTTRSIVDDLLTHHRGIPPTGS